VSEQQLSEVVGLLKERGFNIPDEVRSCADLVIAVRAQTPILLERRERQRRERTEGWNELNGPTMV
jgi:hypothetical protein